MQEAFDDLYCLSSKSYKFKNLMQLITCDANILLAYRNIKKNKGSFTKGTNHTNIIDVGEHNPTRLINYVKNRLTNFQPHSIKRIEIPKKDGTTRPLGIPTIEDRIIQQCIKQVLEPICEAKFYEHSYGFRPNRSTHHALARFNHLVNKGNLYYSVDIDIKSFFDNVNHGKLLKQIWSLGIQDKPLLSILSKMLKAKILGIGTPNKGTPQGGILSPLLSNIVLNELDWWISSQWETMITRKDYGEYRTNLKTGKKTIHRSHKYRALKQSNLKQCFIVRYCDDFKILCPTYNVAKTVFLATTMWLRERLSLDINKEKSAITNLKKKATEFLGFSIQAKPKANNYVAKSHVTKSAMKRMQKAAKTQIHKIKTSPTAKEANRYNAMVLGWHNYYRYATAVNLDFKKIHFSVIKTLYNQLNAVCKNNGTKSKTFLKFYGNYSYKIYYVEKIGLYPLAGVTTKTARSFSQDKCNFTPEGRLLVHDNLTVDSEIIRYIMRNHIPYRSVEYNDNRLSLYIAQNGKCSITKEILRIDAMEVHHKKPRKFGGTDAYCNLTIIHKNVHKLIHAVKSETIKFYLSKLKLGNKELEKMNKLRLEVGNNEIIL